MHILKFVGLLAGLGLVNYLIPFGPLVVFGVVGYALWKVCE